MRLIRKDVTAGDSLPGSCGSRQLIIGSACELEHMGPKSYWQRPADVPRSVSS